MEIDIDSQLAQDRLSDSVRLSRAGIVEEFRKHRSNSNDDPNFVSSLEDPLDSVREMLWGDSPPRYRSHYSTPPRRLEYCHSSDQDAE